jgi:hypothetical protein
MRSLHYLSILSILAAACGGGDDGPVVVAGAIAVSAGVDGSCAIGSGGGLACWGSAPKGTPQDTGMGIDLLGATSIETPVGLIALSLAHEFNRGTGCMVGSTNQVYCWGDLVPVGSIAEGIQPLPGFVGMNSVSVGERVICGARTDRGVRCVGSYKNGVRATDSIADPDAFDLTYNVPKPALAAFGVSIGGSVGCAVRTDSLVACWGMRPGGGLGGAAGDTLENCGSGTYPWCQPGPAPIAGGSKYRQVNAQGVSVCAVRIDGGVDCWGQKVNAEVDTVSGLQCVPSDACLYAPTSMGVPGTATRVGVGARHACALTSTGDVYCWGDNDGGQLGRPGASSATPVKVSGGFVFASLSVGERHTCAIEAGSGAVGCWGMNDNGQLGDGTTENRDHPVAVIAAD